MKIAVVTGASSGMGREFVQQLGYFYKTLDEIWVIARRRERLVELAEKSRVPLKIFDGDLQTFTRIAPQQDELPAKKERQAPRQVSFWPEHPDPNNPWKEAGV